MSGIIATPPARGNQWTLYYNGGSVTINPDKEQERLDAAKRLGVEPEAISQAVDEVKFPPPPRMTMSARSADGCTTWSKRGDDPLALLDEALLQELEYLQWDDGQALAALDYDTAEGVAYSEPYLLSLLQYALPLPVRLWITLHGGIRCIFTKIGHVSAREAAGAFALLAPVRPDGLDAVELLRNTRYPPSGHSILHGEASDLEGLRRRLLTTGGRQPSQHEIVGWLDAHGMVRGARYDHTHCPIAPGEDGSRNPVQVCEDGVLCYRCRGTRGDGWRSWSALISGDISEQGEPLHPVAQMAYHHVHWGHARYIMDARYPHMVEALRREGYAGIARILHGPQYEVASLFRRDLDFFRSAAGLWVDCETQQPRVLGQRTAASMPAGVSGAAVDRLLDTCDIPGYTPVTPMLGVEAPTFQRPDGARLTTGEVYIPALVPGLARPRMSLDQSWALLRAYLPGWDEAHEALLRILLVGVLRQQCSPAMPSMVLVTGPTGSGKGAMAALAAGILGQPAVKLDLGGERTEWSRALGQATEGGAAIAMVDEVGKVRGFWGASSPLLELTAEVHWRRLYTGHVRSRLRSAILLAGSTLPPSMPSMAEMARRLAVVHLPHRIGDWSAAARAAWGVGLLEQLRLSSIPEAVDLCNALWYWAVEEVRQVGERGWVDLCLSYGGDRLASADDEGEARNLLLRRLYRLALDGDPALFYPDDHGRYGAGGWLDATIPRDLDDVCLTPPSVAGGLLVPWLSDDDSERASSWVQLVGILETTDLGEALGPQCRHLCLQVRRTRRQIAIRFVRRGRSRINRGDIDYSDRTEYPEILPESPF